MSRVLPARLTPTRLVPYRWSGGSFSVAGPEVDLVDSPTRLSVMHVKAKTGDTIVIREILKGRGNVVQDLTGATVRFTLTDYQGAKLIDRQTATIVDAAAGSVRYTIAPSVNVPAGVCTFEFEVTWDAQAILTFPDDSDGGLTVRPQVG